MLVAPAQQVSRDRSLPSECEPASTVSLRRSWFGSQSPERQRERSLTRQGSAVSVFRVLGRCKDYWICAGRSHTGAIALTAVLGVLLVVLGSLAVGASAAFPGRNGLIAFNAPFTDGIL